MPFRIIGRKYKIQRALAKTSKNKTCHSSMKLVEQKFQRLKGAKRGWLNSADLLVYIFFWRNLLVYIVHAYASIWWHHATACGLHHNHNPSPTSPLAGLLSAPAPALPKEPYQTICTMSRFEWKNREAHRMMYGSVAIGNSHSAISRLPSKADRACMYKCISLFTFSWLYPCTTYISRSIPGTSMELALRAFAFHPARHVFH